MNKNESPEIVLARFITGMAWTKLPDEAVETTKNAILDTFGVALAGSKGDLGEILPEVVKEMGGKPVSAVIGKGFRTSPPLAALVSGTLAHALDFDDVNDNWIGHPSTVLVPALFAVAEQRKSSGKDIITAYVTGFEVGAKLGMVFGQDHYAKGWHTTGTIGAVAGAAAIANLLKLNARQTQMALGIAASLAGGLRESFGSMTKPLHAGNAAKSAVLSGLLAEKGFTATENSLIGKAAFAQVLGKNIDYDFYPAMSKLGKPLDIISPGLWTKAYPSGAVTHSAISAAIELRKRYAFNVFDVTAVECATNPAVPQIIIHHRPKTGLQGKFSLEYCVAVALLDGDVKLDSFTDKRATSEDVQAFMPKVKYVHPPELENKFGFNVPGIVTVKMRDGREFMARVPSPKGTPENPMTPGERQTKFENCAALVLSPAKRVRVIELVAGLEEMPDVSPLMDVLTGK